MKKKSDLSSEQHIRKARSMKLIKVMLVDIIQTSKKGYKAVAKDDFCRLNGMIMYSSFIGDLDDDVSTKLYNLMDLIRDKYSLWGV